MAGQYGLSDLGGVLGSNLYDSLFSSQGFSGINEGANGGDGPSWATDFGVNDSNSIVWNPTPNQDAMSAFNDYTFNWTPEDNTGAGILDAFNPKGQSAGRYKQAGDDWMDQAAGMLIPALVSGGFGSVLGGMFGGGITGGAAGQGLASGTLSSMQGGKFGDGFLSGAIGGGLQGMAAGTPAVAGNNPSAYVPATPGTSIAGFAGVTNPTLAGMVNRGSGSFLGSLASGKNGTEALQSGLTGAALSGLNSAGKGAMDFYKNSLNSWLSPGGDDADFAALEGSGGDMSGQTDVSPNRYAEMITGSDNMTTVNPDYGFGGGLDTFSSGGPQQSIQSTGQSDFSLASILGDAGRNMGGMAMNNMGDLASMLYGFYNNRKQQKALGSQISSLQSLYGQNSPYATQLRNTLNAKAAATGRRSNSAGRETQFQAMLADRNAQMAPTLMQLNQAKGSLGNNNMNMLLQGMNKLGGFKALGQGLQGLFSPQASLTGPGSFNAYSNMDDMYGSVG